MLTDFNLTAINKVALELGPFQIHWYAICIVLGAALALWLASREAVNKGMTADDMTDYLLIAFLPGLIGVRLYYVAFQWGYYSQHPSEIIALWDGGGAIYGGLIAGAIVLFIFAYYRMINAFDMLDVIVPGVFLAQAFGRWGNFINQEAYGKIVDNLNWLPEFMQKQMFIDGHYRMPTFLLESIGTLLGFLIIMIFRHRIKNLKSGEIFAFYLFWYGLVRFAVEGMRTDSLMIGAIRVSQALSIVLVIFAIVFVIYRRKKKIV